MCLAASPWHLGGFHRITERTFSDSVLREFHSHSHTLPHIVGSVSGRFINLIEVSKLLGTLIFPLFVFSHRAQSPRLRATDALSPKLISLLKFDCNVNFLTSCFVYLHNAV